MLYVRKKKNNNNKKTLTTTKTTIPLSRVLCNGPWNWFCSYSTSINDQAKKFSWIWKCHQLILNTKLNEREKKETIEYANEKQNEGNRKKKSIIQKYSDNDPTKKPHTGFFSRFRCFFSLSLSIEVMYRHESNIQNEPKNYTQPFKMRPVVYWFKKLTFFLFSVRS